MLRAVLEGPGDMLLHDYQNNASRRAGAGAGRARGGGGARAAGGARSGLMRKSLKGRVKQRSPGGGERKG